MLYAGNNGTSVVQFTNLLMFEGRLIYIYDGVIAKYSLVICDKFHMKNKVICSVIFHASLVKLCASTLAQSDTACADSPPSLPEMFVFWDWQLTFEVGVKQPTVICIAVVSKTCQL